MPNRFFFKVSLTDPKKYSDVSGNKTFIYFFFFCLREKSGNFGFSQGYMEGMRKVKEFQNFQKKM